MQRHPSTKAQEPRGELLVWVDVGRLRKRETDVQSMAPAQAGWGSSKIPKDLSYSIQAASPLAGAIHI